MIISTILICWKAGIGNKRADEMKSRISRRKKLGKTKMQFLLTLLLMVVVAGVNFDAIPNVNTYINTHDVGSTRKAKAKFIDQNHVQLNTPEADNVQQFSEQVNSDAVFVAQGLKRSGKKVSDLAITQKNATAFDQYGYSLPQFRELVAERYAGKQETAAHGLLLSEKIIEFLEVVIDLGGLIALVASVIYLKRKKR